MSPPWRLGNGRQSGAAGKIVDAGLGAFSFLRRGRRRGTAIGVFFERQRLGEQQNICALDVQRAVQLMREFDGFSGVSAWAGLRR